MRIMAKDSLKRVRATKGYTTTALAERVGMSRRGYWQAESRLNGFSETSSKAVADQLGVEFCEVFDIILDEDE